MADPFPFELVSPERLLLSESVVSVVVPGTDGEFTVLKDHAPFMATIKPGCVVVTQVGGGVQKFFVRGGFADVNGAGLTILAEQAIPLESLDPDAFALEIRNAEEDVADARDDAQRIVAQTKLQQLQDIREALGH
ncbi:MULTISPECIES: F0F1 ATP synthase subunit epsilon [Kaistia]|uniref:ATP synthase epsilon chain n=1 Tax=Kaistia nematophila TaxID=2994654 RepID=A0A9X3EBW0_9HYPH|nr:F0F1 ATP synthase subunit epsilon [Kaistia nematophila]MBN9024366.1 F0F1 ATP synthase subunit epsilon [Hyphomicrobiales bacterium]MCX5569995.1 F0F1 ATP synthase subunit epsilon [Kaistia nematophila]